MIEQSVGLIGVGRLGSDVALTLAERDLCDIVLYDQDAERAEYLASDLTDTSFGHVYNRRVSWTPSLEDLSQCDVVLVAAGANRGSDDSSHAVFESNRELMDRIADAFIGSSNLFVVASDPVDLMTAELRRSLRLPSTRVLGVGGVVDSYRARNAVGEHLSISPDFIRSHVIGPTDGGAHVLWDYTSVNGVAVKELVSEDDLRNIEEQISDDAQSRAQRLSRTVSRYVPALACFELLRTIVKDDRRIMSVTMEWNNYMGISNVAMSIPAVIGRFGADRAVVPELDSRVVDQLQGAAADLGAVLHAGAGR